MCFSHRNRIHKWFSRLPFHRKRTELNNNMKKINPQGEWHGAKRESIIDIARIHFSHRHASLGFYLFYTVISCCSILTPNIIVIILILHPPPPTPLASLNHFCLFPFHTTRFSDVMIKVWKPFFIF